MNRAMVHVGIQALEILESVTHSRWQSTIRHLPHADLQPETLAEIDRQYNTKLAAIAAVKQWLKEEA